MQEGIDKTPVLDQAMKTTPLEPEACPHANDEILTRAAHFSEDKSGVDQIPVDVLMEWGQVYTFGASKYGRNNWKLGTEYHEFYASALRHLFAFWGGEDIDPESGLSHLVHALWNIAAIRHYQNKGLGTDDRDNPLEAERRQMMTKSHD